MVLECYGALQLFLLTEYTDSYFAWTIQPPLTAAFLGAGYFSSFLLEFLASREKEWDKARIAVPAVFAFTTLTLVATLIHADRFHFNSLNVLARVAAWFWLAIYVIVPPAMLGIWIRQHRMPGEDSERTIALPKVIRAVLATQSILMLIMGLGLFLMPAAASTFWPWKLTALTSRAVGAWLLGIGVFAFHAIAENDHARVRAGLLSFFAFGFLEMIALLRYSNNVDWAKPISGIYVIFMTSVLLIGSLGLTKKGMKKL